MKLIVDKNRLLELLNHPEVGINAHKLLAYTFSEEEGVFRKVIESLLHDVKENDTLVYEILVSKHLLRNYRPAISDLPILLDIIRETQKNNLEPRFYYAGIFAVMCLCLKLDFKELEKDKFIFGDDEIGVHIWEYVSWIEENRNGNTEELKEELISISKELIEEMLKEEASENQEKLDELQDQITDFKNLFISKKDEYSDLIHSSLRELNKTEEYILQDLSIEMAGIWKDKETLPLLIEIARLADPELTVYQKAMEALNFLQSEKIIPIAEGLFQFHEEIRVSFTEILGFFPYDKSEEILLKYLYKEKDKDIVTLCACGLSSMFSLKAATAIKEVADKGKLNNQMVSLYEILLPIYVYHNLEVPEWMLGEENSHL